MKHQILLLGSGLMTPTLIEHLLSFGDTKITVGTNVEAEGMALKKKYGVDMVLVDITKKDQLEPLVKSHTHVISFIPPPLHPHIAQACIKMGKNMTTSSYNSPYLEGLNDEVKAKGLIFLNECGLDPGIDIMSTMKVVHEAQEKGHKVTSYESYCGGLAAAEDAESNPLGYKFSWNPGAAIKTSLNSATYMRDGKVVTDKKVLEVAAPRNDYSVAMKLESYPNRDSTVFMKKFGMSDCKTFVRGTLRFEGFSAILQKFHDIGLTSEEKLPGGLKSMKDILRSKYKGNIADLPLGVKKTLFFLGFFSDEPIAIKEGATYLDITGGVMAVKMALQDTDRDLVVMKHIFKMEDKAKNTWEETSTMIVTGETKKSGGHSIMSLTVGTTCAIATRLVIEGKVSHRGVLSPIHKEIYQPILDTLDKQFGVRLVEESSLQFAKM